MNCPACAAEISPGDTFCKACRASGSARQAAPDPHERFYLVVACVFSLGALAIPRLLKSRAFGPKMKVFLAVVAALQSALAAAFLLFLAIKGPALFAEWQRYIQRTRGY